LSFVIVLRGNCCRRMVCGDISFTVFYGCPVE